MNSTRRMFMKMMGIGTAGLALPSCMYIRRDSWHDHKPIIIFILTDDHPFDATGFMGHPFLETPHMDQMAREGL